MDPVSGEAVITAYNEYDYTGRLIIPDTLENRPVTRIGSGAFSNKYIFEVILPKDLVSIGDGAFHSTYLNEITIPDKVREIGINAFQQCRLSTVSLGAKLESIGAYAFSENDIIVLLLPQSLRSIGAGAFNGSPIIIIDIGEDVEIINDTSMGVYGATFRNYYTSKGKAAGIYRYDRNAWKGPAKD